MVLGASLLVGRPILKKLANDVGARPPLLAPLGDWGGFLGEETTLRGELTFPGRRRKQSIYICLCSTYNIYYAEIKSVR